MNSIVGVCMGLIVVADHGQRNLVEGFQIEAELPTLAATGRLRCANYYLCLYKNEEKIQSNMNFGTAWL